VVYSYAPGRGHIHANALLGGYRGILQCDGYSAYKKFGGSKSADPAVTLAFCWSHVRRGFYDLAKAKAPIAIEALKRIAALYAIEADIRGNSAIERRIARQAESKPLITELRVWFEAQLAKLPARGPTAEAIRYALNHWDGLQRFLDDGRIELDNNSIERAMRPVWTPRVIVHLHFKYLETLEADCRQRCDTGAPYVRPLPPRRVRPGPRPGSGTARREQLARREGCRL
jgi:transposase